MFKALGDRTRYAVYTQVASSDRPLATAEIAEALGLHPNTVRPHLERMREVGLLAVEVDNRGTVGRPQHRYAVSGDLPGFGAEPSSWPLLAALLANVAAAAEPAAQAVTDVGRAQGRAAAASRAEGRTDAAACVAAVVAELDDLGFGPAPAVDGSTTTVAFATCPFRPLAEAFPQLVCELHRGIIEGMVDVLGGAAVTRFATLEDRDPCQVDLAAR